MDEATKRPNSWRGLPGLHLWRSAKARIGVHMRSSKACFPDDRERVIFFKEQLT
jgi:hypothetical protein